MKKYFLLLFAIASTAIAVCQTVTVGFDTGDPLSNRADVNIKDNPVINISETFTTLDNLRVKCTDLANGDQLKISIQGLADKDYNPSDGDTLFKFSSSILNKEIKFKHISGGTEVVADEQSFKILNVSTNGTGGNGNGNGNRNTEPSVNDFIVLNYSNLEPTPYGLVDPNDNNRIVHIFLDEFGNSLISTIPQGISNAPYIVHIIYPYSSKEPNRVSYSIKQKSGSFSSTLLFNNTGIRDNIPKLQSGAIRDRISDKKFLLGTATDDLTFDVIIVVKEDNDKFTKTVLETHTIKMSQVFHGSFDVGLLRTDLSNPTFTLVESPTTSDKVVKVTDESPKGVVTIMASFYTSPIVLLESLYAKLSGKKKIPFFKLTGRSFLDDHKIYERFYPTIGVGVSDKVFENIFYGINWEIARGLSIFGGWHYGKVSTFEMPGFTPGETVVSQKQFDFYQNTSWKTAKCFGVKLDVLIIRNLFGSGNTTP